MPLAQELHYYLGDVVRHLSDVLAAPTPGGPPKPGDVNLPPDASAKISTVLGWIKALVYVACTAGFFIAAGSMAWSWHRGQDAPWGKLAMVAGACIIGGGATGIVDALF